MKIAELLMRETLPRKDFFRASEVSSLLKVRPYEMRYWETEFPKLRSQKTKSGKRIYRREDVVLISAIRHLLQEKKLTIEGAKKVIADMDHVFAPLSTGHEDPPVELFKKCHFFEEEMEHSLWAHVDQEKGLDHDQILGEVSQILDEEDDFDELTHKIYQRCGDDLQTSEAPVKPDEAMLTPLEALPLKEEVSSLEARALALMDLKNRLTEILASLDQFKNLDFWQGFNG